MRSKIADWATLVTAPLTILTVAAPALGWIEYRGPAEDLTEVRLFGGALVIVLVWACFFSMQARIFIELKRRVLAGAALFGFVVIGAVGMFVSTFVAGLVANPLVPITEQLEVLNIYSSAWGVFSILLIIVMFEPEIRAARTG